MRNHVVHIKSRSLEKVSKFIAKYAASKASFEEKVKNGELSKPEPNSRIIQSYAELR